MTRWRLGATLFAAQILPVKRLGPWGRDIFSQCGSAGEVDRPNLPHLRPAGTLPPAYFFSAGETMPSGGLRMSSRVETPRRRVSMGASRCTTLDISHSG